MFRHVRYNEATVEPRTVAGRYLVELLDINDPGNLTKRNTILSLLRAAFNDRDRLYADIRAIEAKLARASNAKRRSLEAGIASLSAEVERLNLAIENLLPQ
jgi:hypothetical protein